MEHIFLQWEALTITGFLTFLLKLLADNVKSKWFWIMLVLLGLPYYLKVISPSAYSLLTISLTESAMIIQESWIPLICSAILAILILVTLRKSDSVFRKELKERHPEYKSYQSRDKRYILVNVGEERKYSKGKSNVRREISIKNTMQTKIKYIQGNVLFFCNEIKVFEVPFEEHNISVNYGSTIYNKLIDRKEESGNWNEFRIYIQKIEYDDKVEDQIELDGLLFYQSYHFLFSRYNYRIFGIFRVRYELSWLMRQWDWKIKPWLINFPRLPHIYVNSNHSLPLARKMKYFFRRKLNQAIWLTIVAPIGVFLYFSISGLLVVSWKLIVIWSELASNLFTIAYA